MNEFLQSEIKRKLSSVQKIPHSAAVADKKIVRVFCVSGAKCSPPESAVQVK